MRAVAFSVWIFINLALLGMGGYIYLIISAYWCRETRHTHIQPKLYKKIKFDRENQVVFYEPEESVTKKITHSKVFGVKNVNHVVHNRVILKKLTRSRRKSFLKKICNAENLNCTNSTQSEESRLEKFKNNLFIQLRRVMHEESNVFKTDNPYFVNYSGPRGRRQKLNSNEIKCKLKKAGLRLLTQDDPPFSNLKIGKLLEEEKFLGGKHFKTCAIVSSAGSLLTSKLGNFIDEHEVVVRFNHAPTKNYEEDVGTKTTIRLVNSQVVSKKEFMFTVNPLYEKTILVVWDPSNYTSTLQQWYEKPDFNFFELWAKQKHMKSKKNSFILDPRSVWKVWDFIQSLTSLRIRRNPPSSGFLELGITPAKLAVIYSGVLKLCFRTPMRILAVRELAKSLAGLALLMPYCDVIDFFEFVPSFRLTKRCHYFDEIEDDSCTFGVWHPLSAEKMLSLAMNEANDTSVFEKGFIRVQGYKNLEC